MGRVFPSLIRPAPVVSRPAAALPSPRLADRPRVPVSLALALLVLLTAALPAVAAEPAADLPPPPYLGPPDGFSAAESGHLRYFVEAGAPLDATAFAITYGAAADRAVDELTALFPAPNGRIELYAYATEDAYLAATAGMPRPEPAPAEAAAVADPGRGDIAVSLPRLLARSPLEAENALRHALAHVVARRASGWELPRGFDEGFALYAERPVSARLARHAALLQNAAGRDALLSWSDLNRPQPPSVDPATLQAHAYGIVAFLVERHGLRRFAEYAAALRQEADWRTAMRSVYQRPPSELEEQWRENLPRWAAGGWRENLFAAFDLQPAEDLLAKAHYAAAKTELERSLRLFADLGDTEGQAKVEALLRQGDVGLQAEALMGQVQQALERHTYDRADTLASQARAQYQLLPAPQRPTDLLDSYAEMSTSGLRAGANLEAAQRLFHRWADYPEARAAAVDAGTAFASLGDEEQYQVTRDLLADLDGRQRRLVLMLGALAALTIAWLALWLWARGPDELDWR